MRRLVARGGAALVANGGRVRPVGSRFVGHRIVLPLRRGSVEEVATDIGYA